jgi:hypothetical protein
LERGKVRTQGGPKLFLQQKDAGTSRLREVRNPGKRRQSMNLFLFLKMRVRAELWRIPTAVYPPDPIPTKLPVFLFLMLRSFPGYSKKMEDDDSLSFLYKNLSSRKTLC